MYKKVYTHVCLTSGILLCTKMGILSAQQRCELYILSFNHVQEYSKGLGVAQLTSAIMICVTNISQARRPICRLEDVRHGETEAYHLEGCEHLDLAFADIKDSGAYALASQLDGNQGIKRIYLTGCGLSEDGASALTKGLRKSNIEELYLWKNDIGDEGAAKIAQHLKHHPTLRVLYVGYNNIGDRGCLHMAKLIELSDKIETLDLRGNSIGPDGAKALAAAIAKNKSLKKLYLFNNKIDDKGAAAIQEALESNEGLHTLHMHDNDVHPNKIREIMNQIVANKDKDRHDEL
eukprot:m.28203 g.28203  ORF g.28203 m.28203 type:complete len:291 (+) comp7982_c0_seq1:220-1092(+)